MARITDTTLNDVKDAAEEKFEDVKESVEDTVDATEARVQALSTAKKVAIFTAAVVVSYSIVTAVTKRFLSRNDAVVEGDIIVVTADEVEEA